MLSSDARILRGCALVATPVGILAVVLSTVLAGSKGLIGALVALAVVVVVFAGGFAALMRLTKDKPQLVLTGGLLVYAVQMLLAGVFIVVFKHTTLFSGKAFGFSLLATLLAWVGAQVWFTLKSKTLYVDPSAGPEPGDKPGGKAGT
jgi:ATP synthase protein I